MKHHQWNGSACALLALLVMLHGCGDDGGPAPGVDANPNACVPMPLPSFVVDPGMANAACPITECGQNSAEVNDLPIGEMHITPGENTGEINAWGAQLIDFIAPDGSNDYIIYYDDGQLFARRGPDTLAGADLIDGKFVIRNTATCEDIEVRIENYDQQPSWTTPIYQVDRYRLTYVHPDAPTGPERPICTDAGEDPVSDSAWAVLVGGERYTWESKVVRAAGAEAAGWFNFACSDNALYKMKFTGYDPFPRNDNPFVSVPEDRQATLKMMTGDYCGTGTSFTETGTPLYWVNKDGWSENAAPPDSLIEAFWGPEGALCLGLPRLMDVTLQDVADECANVSRTLPPCDEANPPANYVWESRVPAPM